MINIYDKVKIIYNEKQEEFDAVDTTTQIKVGTSKDLDTIVKIKKAYCDGYYDGYHAKEREIEKERLAKLEGEDE